MKKVISTAKAPAAIGPYSQGIDGGAVVITSGQLPLDPAAGAFPEGVAAQTRQSLLNVQAVLGEAGLTMDNVIKTTVFLKDMNEGPAGPQRCGGGPPAQGRAGGDRGHRRALTAWDSGGL